MHSQIQCPVCTLYLHVGMNLYVHLDTHPKDQVIRALVNMTVVQSSPDDEPVNQMQCSNYAPLNDESLAPSQMETPNKSTTIVSIAAIPSVAVVAPKPADTVSLQATSLLSPNIVKVTTLTAPTVVPLQTTRSCQLPPPPPYGEYSKLCAIVRSDSNTVGISTHARNHILQEATSTPPTDSTTIYPNIETLYLDDADDEFHQDEDIDEYITDNQFEDYDHGQVSVEEQLQEFKDTDMDTSVLYQFAQTEEAVNQETVLLGTKTRRIGNRRRSTGLHVLSDVTLTPDLEITSIINVQKFKNRTSGKISLSDMIHSGSSANKEVLSKPNQLNTSNSKTAEETCGASDDKSLENLPYIDAMCKSLSIDDSAEDDDVEIVIPNNSNVDTPERNIKIVKIESLSPPPPPIPSSATTSVIRMASSPLKTNNSPTTLQDESEVQPSTSENATKFKQTYKPIAKHPFTKTPKKLIVKFKKPFVPVIEEEANLQPPDRHMEQDETKVDIREASPPPSATEETFASLDSHPFSPFRQSYTPVPLNTLNDDEDMVNSVPLNTLDEQTDRANSVIIDKSFEHERQIDCIVQTHCEDDSKELVIIDMDTVEQNQSDDKEDVFFQSECQPESSSTSFASTSNNSSYVSNATPSTSTSTSFSTESSSTSTTPRPGPSNRSDYGLCLMLGYNTSAPTDPPEQPKPLHGHSTDAFSTPLHINEYGWTQRFSPQYVPFESDKSTYTNLDECKTISRNSIASSSFNQSSATAATTSSSDSLNIRTDEQMPAKGEISEQESNGDLDGSWSLHVYPLQDTLPRYTSSYDTTVARESWSLGNGPSGSQTAEANAQNICTTTSDSVHMILPKFPSLESTFNNDEIDQKPDIKPNIHDVFLLQPQCHSNASDQLEVSPAKIRRFRCVVCPLVFFSLKTKRQHLNEVHHIKPPSRRVKATSTVTSNSSSIASDVPLQISTVSSLPSTAAKSMPSSDPSSLGSNKLSVKDEVVPKHSPTVINKKSAIVSSRRTSRLNYYLLNYNWTVLRDRIIHKSSDDIDEKLPILPTETNTYMCMVCHATFKSVRSFDEHMAIHPSECYTCGREFRHWYNLSIHLKRHLNIKDHQCKNCPKRFVSRNNLIEHMYMHSTEARLQCKICLRRFRRQSNLILHRKREHFNIRPRKKDFICWCGEVFHTKAKIAWHRETHDKTPKCCPHCRERFIHRNSLSRHIRISHTDHFVPGSGTEMVKCTICAKKFLKTSLKLHMTTHDSNPETNGTIDFACTICNKSFTTKWNLKQHKWVHASRSTKPFRCTYCPKAFIREADFHTHINTHKSIKPYTCDHCGLQFARKYNWLRHTREHEKPKGFKCDDCGKIFHRAYYLKEHRRTHTGERPFECVICGKTSTTKTNHNKHIKIHHARDPMPAET